MDSKFVLCFIMRPLNGHLSWVKKDAVNGHLNT